MLDYIIINIIPVTQTNHTTTATKATTAAATVA